MEQEISDARYASANCFTCVLSLIYYSEASAASDAVGKP